MPYNLLFAALLLCAALVAGQQFFDESVSGQELKDEEEPYCAPCECPILEPEPMEEEEDADTENA